MQDKDKSKAQLISELQELRQQVSDSKMLEETYHQLENALQETERYYNTFLDLMPVAIFTKNVEGRYTRVNADTLKYWSHSPVGYTDAELLPADIADKLRAVDLQVMETGQGQYLDEQLLVNGEIYTLLSKKVPLKSTDGTIMGILGISLNITEQRRAEAQHIQLEVERERTKLLSDFMTQVSHEFRTPLTIIKSSAYLLEKTIHTDRQIKHVCKINDQADNIEILVQNMITLSEFASHQPLASERIDLNEILNAIKQGKQSDLQDHGLGCELELDDDKLWVVGNASYFEHAIEHILDNAIQHTPQGGNLIIRSSHSDNTAVIDVIDSGSGINATDLPYIFDRFYRADKAGVTRGFGLGLPIAKATIERFGGSLTVQSTSEVGSHFRISLPMV